VAVDPYALTSLDTIKSHLNIPAGTTSEDEVLERMINAASEKIEQFLDRKILKRSWTEYQDGRSNDRIVLRQWPCSKPSELWDDASSEFTDASNMIDDDDFALEGDPAIGVVLLGGWFSRANRNIKIVYEAGYDVVPYDLEEACLLTIEFMYDMRADRRVGVSSKGKNSESVKFLGNLPQFVTDMLMPYQRFEFGLSNIAVQNS
jgi:uncharacterized phiE125 gp8 family phage protein